MKSKDQKIFNFISHTVMIAVTIIAVLPFILVFVSSAISPISDFLVLLPAREFIN